MTITTEELINSISETRKKPRNNISSFIHTMQFSPSENRIPFYIIYWCYKKWCTTNKEKYTKVVSKHVLSRDLGVFFKKLYTYPKTKKFGVRIDYQMSVCVESPYLPLSEEEEALAFHYYHYLYDQDRSTRKALWKTKRKQKEKKKNIQA
jgi:hypothetical protein